MGEIIKMETKEVANYELMEKELEDFLERIGVDFSADTDKLMEYFASIADEIENGNDKKMTLLDVAALYIMSIIGSASKPGILTKPLCEMTEEDLASLGGIEVPVRLIADRGFEDIAMNLEKMAASE